MPRAKTSTAIIGVGETQVGRVPGVSSLDMAALVSGQAIKDAGLKKEDIEAVLTGGSMTTDMYMYNARLADRIGIKPNYASVLPLGGTTFCHAVIEADALISAGVAKNVLVVAADPLLSALGGSGSIDRFASFQDELTEVPHGFMMPAIYGMAARRHMHLYGTTREQLAQVAVSARKHASHNPLAQYRSPLTIDQVLEARPVASPFGVYDCSPVSDGGGAFIVTSADLASDCPKRPVYVLAAGEAHEYEYSNPKREITLSAAGETARQMYEQSGIRASDVSFAELYDCFTITVLVTLEDLGFCSKGESGPFAEHGNIEIGGSMPVNTHGGLLSHGHPGTPAGIFHVIEAVKQLRREVEPERAVVDARLALIHGNGGMLRDSSGLLLGIEQLD